MAEQQTLIPTLHHLEDSQSFRVVWALEELAEAKGTKYNIKIHGRSGKYGAAIKKYYPMGKSPTLSMHNSDGSLSTEVFQDPNHPGVLTESRLILKFLSNTYGGDLWRVSDPEDQRREDFVCEFANGSLGARMGFCLLFELIPMQMPFGIRQLAGLLFWPLLSYFKVDVTIALEIMEAMLTAQKPWFSGSKMGEADLNASWPMDVCVQRGYVDLEKFPNLKRWYETITSRPAYKRALEKGGKYDLVSFS